MDMKSYKWIAASFAGLLSVGVSSAFLFTTDPSAKNISPATLIESATQKTSISEYKALDGAYNPVLANKHN